MPLSDDQLRQIDAIRNENLAGDVGLSLYSATQQNPDEAARNQKLAADVGLPVDTVGRNYPEVSAQAHRNSFDIDKLVSDSPVTAQYLSNPDNAAVSHDDIDTLTGIESVMKEDRGFIDNTTRGVISRTNKLIGDLMEFGGTVADDLRKVMPIDPGIKIGEDGISWSWDLGEEGLPSALTVMGQYVSEGEAFRVGYKPDFTWEKLKGDVTPTNLAGYIIEQGVQSLPDMAATIAVLPAYIASRTQDIAEKRAANDVRTDVTTGDLVDSVVTATLVSLMERLAAKVVLTPGGFTTATGAAKAVGAAVVTEAGTEFVQEGTEYFGETIGTRKELSGWEALDRAVAGAVVGGPMGGIIRSTTAPFDLYRNRAMKNAEVLVRSTMEQANIDNMITLAQSSKTSQRAQDQFKSFLSAAGKDRAVYIPASEIQSLIEQGVELPAWITSQATNPDVDITIPMDRFATEIAVNPELTATLRPHIKWSSESMTSTEMAENGESAMQALIKRANEDKAVRAESDRIYDLVKDQIIATGRQGEQTAKWSAAIIPAYVSVLAQRTGKTPTEIYEMMNFRIDKMVEGEPTVAQILSQAADEGYEGTSIGEAAEWSAAVAKGLDMSREGRMARAAEQGFDVEQIWYHGTTHQFSAFAPMTYLTSSAEEASAYGMQGLRARMNRQPTLDRYKTFTFTDVGQKLPYYGIIDDAKEDYGDGTYITDEGVVKIEDRITYYADNVVADYDSIEYDPAIGNYSGGLKVDPDAAKQFFDAKIADINEFYDSQTNDSIGESNQVLPVVIKDGEYKKVDALTANLLGARLNVDNEQLLEKLEKLQADINQWISEGYVGIETISDDGLMLQGVEIPQRIVFNPSNIRSVNAAFDPDSTESANLLAQDALRREVINIPGRGEIEFGPNEKARDIARSLGATLIDEYVPVLRQFAERIANEFQIMKHNPNDPEVKAAYDAMIKETMEQYKAIIAATGLEIHFIKGENPYEATPRLAILDIVENNRFYVYSTKDGFGSGPEQYPGNPLLAETDVMIDGEPALANDIFRIVHDYFGHTMNGVGFRAGGEENAWQAHAGMYSRLARRAMTTETRGQNSWVNYGPHGDFNRTASGADTIYADQKIGLLPVWVSEEYYAGETRQYPESRVGSSGELLSPPVENGRIELTHFSRTPDITRLDPGYYGSNYAGAEKYRQSQPDWLDRTYYGIKPGFSGGYKRESRTGGIQYTTSVDARLVYDYDANPDNLPRTSPNSYEKAIRDAGYVGYWTNHPSLGLVAASFDPLYTDKQQSGVLYQSKSFRKGTRNLSRYGIQPGETHKTRDVAAALEAWARDKFGTIARDDRSPGARDKIAGWMAEEVLYEMEHPEKSGVGWYSEKFQRALNTFGKVFPELLTDPNRRDLLTALIGITSDGLKVVPNFRMAIDIYANFRKTGKFTTEIGHAREASITNNIQKIQHLYDTMGEQGMHDYLMQEATVGELKKIAKESGLKFKSDYKVDVRLPMAAVIFGPKLGAFYANLMGAHGYLTMDRWWSRSFNRYRGSLVMAPTPVSLDNFRKLINDPTLTDDQVLSAVVEPHNNLEARGFKTRLAVLVGRSEPKDTVGKAKWMAEAKAKAGDNEFSILLHEHNVERTANTIYKMAFENIEDAPFNAGDRSFMLDSVNAAQKKLKRRGLDVSIADIQAILWYYEKRLYGDLGARQTADVSYEEAATRVASELDATGERIVPLSEITDSEDSGDVSPGEDTETIAADEPQQPLTLNQAQRNSIGLYSSLETAIEKLKIQGWKNEDDTVTGAQLIEKLQPGKTEGVKAEEVEWTGLVDFLEAGDRFTRGQVLDFVRANGVQVEEVIADQDVQPVTDLQWDDEVLADSGMYEGDTDYYIDTAADWFDFYNWLKNNTDDFLDNIIDPTIHDQVRSLIEVGDLDELQLVMERAGLNYQRTLNAAAESDIEIEALERARQFYMEDPVTLYTTTTPTGNSIEIEGSDATGYSLRIDGDFIGEPASYNTFNDADTDALDVALNRGLMSDQTAANVTRFGDDRYNMAGRYTNYRELKLTLPGLTGDAFVKGEHFEDPNIVAFLRVDDRKGEIPFYAADVTDEMVAGDTIPDEFYFDKLGMSWGEYKRSADVSEVRVKTTEETWSKMPLAQRKEMYKTAPLIPGELYFIEELQSDWHQQGRQKGYQDVDENVDIDALMIERDALFNERDELRKKREAASTEALATVPGIVDGEPLMFDGQQLTAAKWRAMTEGLFNNPELDFQRPEMAAYISEKMREFNLFELHNQVKALDAQARSIAAQITGDTDQVPNAPFKGDAWLQLGMKRAIADAIDRGADQLAWSDAEVLVDRWGDHYRQLYMTQYNDKMPSIVKKLTGQQPRHLDRSGNPVAVELKMLRNDKQIEAQLADTGEIFARTYTVDEDGARVRGSTSKPERIEDIAELESFKGSGDNRLEVFSHNPTEQEQGVWVIDITPELKARFESQSTLFQEPEAPRGQIEILNNERIIRLGKASDLSTFLHEAGHLFLEVEKQLEAEGFVNEDTQAILDFVGANSLAEITAETPEGVEMHEKFARAFEAYLREGKAPSLSLRNAFARIKEWMMRLYQSADDLDVELDDSIRGVFDRMLATETEIKEAMSNPAYDQYFKSKEQAGMTDAEWADYQKRVQARKDKATTTVDAKLMKEYTSRYTKEWDEERKVLIEDEIERLSKLPVYSMLNDLPAAPMDYDMVIAALGGGKLPGKLIGKARKVDGIDPAEYAEVYGFDTVASMLAEIQAAPALKKAAFDAAQARMIEMHGDILNDGTIEAEVREALHNDEQAEVLLAELKALRPSNRPVINRDYLKAEAKRLISTMKYGEIKPNKFYQAEIKAAKRAATAEGTAAVYDAKVQQLVNHYLYREAVDTRQQMERDRRYVKRAQTRKYDNKIVDAAYIANIKVLANMYDFRTEQLRRDQIDSLLNWYDAQLSNENSLADLQLLDPVLILAVKARRDGQFQQFKPPTFDDLTASQLAGVADMLKHLRFVGGQNADQQTNEIAALRNALTESIVQHGGRDVKDPETPGRKPAGSDRFQHLINKLPSLLNLLRKLDGFEFGPAQEIIYRLVEDMTNTRLDLGVKLYEKFKEEMDGIHNIGLVGTDWSTDIRKKFGTNVPGEFSIRTDAGRTATMNSEELFMLAVYWGTESSREAIREGHGFSDNDVRRLLSNLTKDQLKFVNATWRVNESVWPDLSGASIKRFGTSPEKLDATPFEVNGVQMTGGHMRLFYNTLEMELKEAQGAGESYATIVPSKAGSLHERIGSGGRPVLLDKNSITRALDESIHFIAFAEGSQTIRRLINAKDVQAVIQQKHGDGYHKALIEQLDNLLRNKQATEAYPGLSKLFNLTRKAATARHLMFSVRNTVQQIGSLPIAASEVGTVNLFNAMAKFTTDYGASRDFVLERSAFMRNRTSLVNREANEFLKNAIIATKFQNTWQKFVDAGFTPQTVVDAGIAFPTWMAKYEQAIAAHGDERRAQGEADAAVAESVGSGADIHLGGAFNSNTTEFARTMTLFGSWFNAYYNRMYRDTKGFNEWTPASFATLVTAPMMSALLSAVVIMDFPDDDSDEEYWAWALKRYGSFMAGTVPILRDVVGFGLTGFSPKTVLAGAQEGPARLGQEVEAFLEGRQTGLKTASDVAKVVTTVVPVPGSGQITRVLDYVDSYYAGKEGEFSAYQALTEGPNRNK